MESYHPEVRPAHGLSRSVASCASDAMRGRQARRDGRAGCPPGSNLIATRYGHGHAAARASSCTGGIHSNRSGRASTRRPSPGPCASSACLQNGQSGLAEWPSSSPRLGRASSAKPVDSPCPARQRSRPRLAVRLRRVPLSELPFHHDKPGAFRRYSASAVGERAACAGGVRCAPPGRPGNMAGARRSRHYRHAIPRSARRARLLRARGPS
jgi:hypothetical protein